ncbi:MAG: hypothetical protein D6706_20505 [Chloroflexi bacterium]|nr:MAG: hypothetical protein D6706_20505 [Chloroflexota bacterium]
MSLTVADRYGNPVPDGTVLNVGLVDKDDLNSAGTRTSRLLVDSTVGSTAGTTLNDTAVDFTTASSSVNGNDRWIEANDYVLIPTAPAADKVRQVGSIADANNLSVNKAYTADHVGEAYQVGAALTGSLVFGKKQDGVGTLTRGTVETTQGVGWVVVRYPNEVIFDGYYLVARSSDDTAARIFDMVYYAQAPASLVPDITTISNSSTVEFTLEDAGGYALEGVTVSTSVKYVANAGGLVVTASPSPTDSSGRGAVTITVTGGVSGDQATVTLSAVETSATITVTIQ